MNTTNSATPPTPMPIFQTMSAFQRTAALKAAIELDLFTAIDNGASTTADIAKACSSAERGVRILCDYLVIIGHLTKTDGRYGLPTESKLFLSKSSPAYFGSVAEFLLSPHITDSFARLTDAVRQGGTAMPDEGTLSPENEVWVRFARAMGPMMAMPSEGLAKMVLAGRTDAMTVLDVSASHGLFGLAFARLNPQARVTGLDWANVLEVAKANAAKMGVADRFSTIAGSAFEAPLGGPYDVVLLPNFLHHFDPPTVEKFLKRVRQVVKPGGRVVTLEFVPNDDRVTPPEQASFSIVMLSTTPSGDAYTFAEYEQMFSNAGFGKSALHRMSGAPHSLIVTEV